MKTMRGMVLLGMVLLAGTAAAQNHGIAGATQARGAYEYFARAGWTFGAGSSGHLSTLGPTVQVGGVVSVPFLDFEFGVLGPQAGHSKAGYVTTNAWVPLLPLRRVSGVRNVPLVVGGYTREWEAGNALDYGLSLAHTVREGRSFQFDVRDYWLPSESSHTVMFRLVFLVGLSD